MVESKVMIFGLFRGRRNASVIERLHGDIVAAARDPVLFTDYGIADTLDGRFESLALHGALALRRLKALPAPAPEIAQDLADAIFRHFDIGLREMGVSDTGVARRMRDLAEAFLGRANAYGEALAQPGAARQAALAAALARNIFADGESGEQLARYTIRNDEILAQMSLADFLKGPIFRVKAASNLREVRDD
jgi:cytochrome b pre-mRNA-processing protein 3